MTFSDLYSDFSWYRHGYERVRDEDFIQISLVVPSKADAGDNANKASEEFLNALVLGN